MSGHDVVVVGARVAGASTALLLARAGLRVALVDRSVCGSDTPSTHALMRAGVLQLSRWGLLDRVVAAGTPPVHSTVFHHAGGPTTRVSVRRSPGVDALYAPRRTVLDRILVEAAAEAGVDVSFSTTVTGLQHDPAGRVVGVRVRRPGRPARTLQARVVVGADGVGSTVATAVAAPVLRRGSTGSALIYRYVDDLPVEGYEWAFGAGAAAGLIPTNGGQTCVFAGTTPARMRALRREGVEAAFVSLLERAAPALTGRVEEARGGSRMHGWAARPGFARRSGGPGWALVGDAGRFNDPITTHGMTDGLRDAELLADQLVAALSGAVPEAVALGRYQATRERLTARLTVATEAVAAYDWEPEELQVLMRQVSSATSDEVDYLQSLPERRVARNPSARIPVADESLAD